jgi:Flp pilus assembly protein TadG
VTPRVRDERGQTAVMIVGFFMIALLMVGVAVDASAAYLRRQGLDSLADAAALAAADGIQGRQVYEGGLGERAQIDPAVAREYVAAYVRGAGATSTYPGLRWQVDATTERVVVRMSTPLDLPIMVPGVDRRAVISSTAASYVVVSD